MSEFKIGDRVIAVDFGGSTGSQLLRLGVGYVYTVLGVGPPNPDTGKMLLSVSGFAGGALDYRFRLFDDSPTQMDETEYEDIIAGDKIYKELT